MKIRIKVENVVTGNQWTEDYDKPGIGDNGNQLQAEDWANNLIDHFNNTCSPGESHRKLLEVTVLGESTDHTWDKRITGMSITFRGRIADVFYCTKCGITGKRFGLGHSGVKRDAKYQAKKYEQCSGSRIVT